MVRQLGTIDIPLNQEALKMTQRRVDPCLHPCCRDNSRDVGHHVAPGGEEDQPVDGLAEGRRREEGDDDDSRSDQRDDGADTLCEPDGISLVWWHCHGICFGLGMSGCLLYTTSRYIKGSTTA